MSISTTALTAEFLTRLRTFVRRRVRSEHDAEDIVQDVLAKFIRGQHDSTIHERGGSPSVYAWLFTAARRAIIDRARAADSRTQRGISDDELVLDLADDPSAPLELARCLEPMLTSLSSDDRILLQRIDMAGESQADLARELEMSMSGLKSRVQRARQRLRGRLEDCCMIERDRLGQPADYQRKPDRPCPCDHCE